MGLLGPESRKTLAAHGVVHVYNPGPTCTPWPISISGWSPSRRSLRTCAAWIGRFQPRILLGALRGAAGAPGIGVHFLEPSTRTYWVARILLTAQTLLYDTYTILKSKGGGVLMATKKAAKKPAKKATKKK